MILSTFGKVFTRLRASRRAGLALMTGLALPFLIGAAGLATDSAFWFAQHSALQSAVDAGAVAAARDMETIPAGAANPDAITPAIITDVVTAANNASSNQFGLTAASLNIRTLGAASQGGDPRRVQVDATAPAKLFFSPAVHMGNFNISTRAVAGVSYSLISTQATCQALDSFTYIYSTGFGTLETAHSSGIDPYTCGQAAIVPPLPVDTYCNGGILGCLLAQVTTPLGLNIGGALMPVAFQVEPSSSSTPNNSAGPATMVLSSVLATIPSLLGGMTSTTTGTPTTFQQGSASCPNSVCTITAGVYAGGIVIGPNVTFNFAANGSGATKNYFVLLNGNLVISTQAKLGASTGTNNFTFFMIGATPGAYVAETQVQLNLAPIAQGGITYTSTSNFAYNSLLGTQISAPYSQMPYAEQQAATGSAGLLGNFTLPGGNVVGSNYVTVLGVCSQATSFCTTAASTVGPQYLTTLMPGGSGALATVQSSLNSLSLPFTSFTSSLFTGISGSGTTTSTTFSSGVQIANGTPTDWTQTETQSANINSRPQSVNSLLSGLSSALNQILAILFPSSLTSAVNNVYAYITGVSSLPNPGSANASGLFTGQTTQLASGSSTPGCATGATNLYAGTVNITPNFGPVFSNLAYSSTSNTSAQSLALTTTDNILICGTTSQATTIAQIMPGQTGQTGMTGSAAAGASTLALLQ